MARGRIGDGRGEEAALAFETGDLTVERINARERETADGAGDVAERRPRPSGTGSPRVRAAAGL